MLAMGTDPILTVDNRESAGCSDEQPDQYQKDQTDGEQQATKYQVKRALGPVGGVDKIFGPWLN
jgi:hypothetical protein